MFVSTPEPWSAVPGELKDCPQWTAWRYVMRGGKRTKPPCDPRGFAVDQAKSPQMLSFDEAVRAFKADKKKILEGIGFVFVEGGPFCGVDLDDCIDRGQLEPWAKAIVGSVDSYSEVSPSGTGVKIFAKAHAPGPRRRQGKIEMYFDKRYFTVTGNRLPGTPSRINSAQEAIDELYRQTFGIGANEPSPTTITAEKPESRLELLMAGRMVDAGFEDQDQSRAVASLLVLLFLRYRDREFVEFKFRQSWFFRESHWSTKWERLRETELDHAEKFAQDSTGATLPSVLAPTLAERIRAVAVAPAPNKDNSNGIRAFDRPRKVYELVIEELRRRGKFFCSTEGRSYYFFDEERNLYELGDTIFGNLLKHLSGLSETEHFFKFSIDTLAAEISRTAPRVQVHTLAYLDTKAKRHMISDGASGVWWRNFPGGEWVLGHNGQDGIYFATEKNVEQFSPDFSSYRNDRSFDWYWQQFLFAAPDDRHIDLTPAEYRLLLEIFLLQQLFPSLRSTRIIPAFLGPQGGGKTTAAKLIGRFLVGASFDVTGVGEAQEKDWIAAVSNRIVVAFDNADSRIKWLPDSLARYATGQRFQLRKLYTTNEEVSFSARAIILLTSRDPHFNRPDVAERLLPILVSRPKNETYIPEFEIFEKLKDRRNRLWGELLTRAAEFADRLNATAPIPINLRMADYGSFGMRVLGNVRRPEWEGILWKLTRAQSEFATEGDSITTTLAALLARQDGTVGPMTTGELYNVLRPIALSLNLWFPEKANGFGKMLTHIKRQAEISLGVEITVTRRQHEGKRIVTIRRLDKLKFS
jgi:hypothetical protein